MWKQNYLYFIFSRCEQLGGEEPAEFKSGDGSGPGSGLGSGIPPEAFPPSLFVTSGQNIGVIPSARLFINITYNVGSPRGFLMWRLNGSIISNRTDPRVTVLGGGGLIIRNMSSRDEGQYNVTVANELGSDSRIFNVVVIGT